MIAIESFKKYKIRDILTILIFALLFFIGSSLAQTYLDAQIAYILSLLILTTLMSFLVHLLRKAGTATLFYLFCGLFTPYILDLGATGIEKAAVLLLAGIIFEVIYLIFRLEIKSIQLDIILGTAFSAASIPFLTSYFLSTTVASVMVTSLINMSLLSFFVGVIGAILSFLVWYSLRTNKYILKYAYSV